MREDRKMILAGAGGVSALASALCCAGPLIAVAAGVSGAGLASTFDPLRPYFLGTTAAFLLASSSTGTPRRKPIDREWGR